ncbi:FecR family protein [Niastella populi]|uniref:FecR protein domain-containing protein n=1 Tax=Niastella populi TaxID=550983 RepID=A0A1V9FM61_9BACT|nr:FecR domain-containing protein [Niastella populi]OQP59381.1 hypothetical protein A4R26_21430 [Niastella populi]
MSETHKPISTLVVNYLLGTATPTEITQLEKWASLSAENRNLLHRFNNHRLLRSRLQQLDEIDLQERVNDFHRRLREHKTKTSLATKLWQNKHIAKLWRYKYEAAAAILCLILVAPYLYKLALTRDAAITPSVATTLTKSKKQTVHHPHPETTFVKHHHQPASPRLNKSKSVKKTPLLTNQIKKTTDVQSTGAASRTNPWANDPETQPPTSATKQSQIPMEFAAKNKPMANNIIGPRQAEHLLQNEDKSLLKDHPLPDQSLITLNAASTLKYPNIFKGNKRRIELNGEGYIEAKQADAFPFLVVANTVHIETAGGTFNVRAYEDEAQTQITALTGNNLVVAAGPYQATVQPGQMAVITKGSPIEVYNNIDPNAISAYTRLEFQFNNAELNRAAAEIARWYDVPLDGTAPSHIRISFTGTRGLHLEDLKNLINNLTTSDNKPHLKLADGRLVIE